MLRCAMVAYTYYVSDPRVLREAEALAGRGDEVEVFCLRKPGEAPEETVQGVRLRRLPLARYRGGNSLLYVGSYLAFLMLALVALGGAHLRHRYRIVHVHNMPDFMVFAAIVPRLLGARVLLDIHDTMPEIYRGKFGVGNGHPLIRLLRFQERLSAHFAHHVLTSEHTKKDALIAHGLDGRRIEVVLNLPDPRIFAGGVAPAADGPPAGNTGQVASEFRLVFHGTLAKRLGVDVAIRAAARLHEEMPRLRFDVIGDGDQREALIALAKELGVEERVRFSEGVVPVEELPALLRGVHLGVIPTREEISTRYMLPTKLLEYIALGIPAVVAPTHTIRHYFDESQVAFFVPGDDESLAKEIRALAGDPERRRSLARAASRFLDTYSWESDRRVYLDLVDRLAR
ncbi:MAG: glycosyltransferase family 4 protein [Candidatus Eiseniibacteriota bacterium]